MDFSLFNIIQGIAIGIVISLPLGPVALITMKRSALHGHRAGIIAGLAIALIDTVAMALILLSLHHSIPFLRHVPLSARIIGSVIVFGYGLHMIIATTTYASRETLPWHRHFLGSALMTLSNPSTYVSFGLIGLMLARYIDKPLFTKLEVAVGFFIGAWLWWWALTFFAVTHRSHLEATYLRKLVGIIIMILAIGTLVSSLTTVPHVPILFDSM